MIVESVNLENYRNYESLSMEFISGINILYGDNAQGKTNVLESIYLSGTSKSHRGSKDKEMIRFNQEESHIKVIINKNDVPYRIDMHLKKNKTKGIAINGIPIKKASELFGILNVVFFSPEDLSIIKNGPSERRRFIDMELCQLDKVYLFHLTQYNKVIGQRNKLLKDLSFKYDKELYATLDIWDKQLVEYGNKIIQRREEFIKELDNIIHEIHGNLSGGKESVTLRYETNTTTESFAIDLQRNKEKDLKLKTTSVGPHRDDMGFYISDIDIRKFGSQGQQRTAALSLKLSEIEFVKNIIHDTPVLLLDDVMSELDSHRQNQLLNSLQGLQTIVTCTGLDEFIENRIHMNRIYKIVSGTASLYEESN